MTAGRNRPDNFALFDARIRVALIGLFFGQSCRWKRANDHCHLHGASVLHQHPRPALCCCHIFLLVLLIPTYQAIHPRQFIFTGIYGIYCFRRAPSPAVELRMF